MKMALLKFSRLIKDMTFDDFDQAEAKELTESQENILQVNAKYFLLAGGSLSAEEMCFLTTAELVAIVKAREEIEEEKLLKIEQFRRLEDNDIQTLRDSREPIKHFSEAERIQAYCLSAVLASGGR